MEKIFKIDGMSCSHCVMSVQKALSKLNLNSVKVEIGSAKVEFDEKQTDEKKIIETIEEAGYNVIQS